MLLVKCNFLTVGGGGGKNHRSDHKKYNYKLSLHRPNHIFPLIPSKNSDMTCFNLPSIVVIFHFNYILSLLQFYQEASNIKINNYTPGTHFLKKLLISDLAPIEEPTVGANGQ